LHNNNSNASDGSWLRSLNLFEVLTKNLRFVLFEGIL
jgi:hypothetical protein